MLRTAGREWLIASLDGNGRDGARRAVAWPARFRLPLLHEDRREEVGAFCRFRTDVPRLGHTVTTTGEDGRPIAWLVLDQRVAEDADGVPYLDLVAARSYDKFEAVPDHELEHASLAPSLTWRAVQASLAWAAASGLAVEMVALEAG